MKESELKDAYNDGMDPYWKPKETPSKIKGYTEKLENLYWASKRISECLGSLSDEFLEENKFKDYQYGYLTTHVALVHIIKLRKALKEIEA